MSKNEIMYNYSKREYDNAINRKNEIRNRSATFYSIGFTIMSGAATITFSLGEGDFSVWKIYILSISLLSLIGSTLLFLVIYSPSNQKIHSPKNVLSDLRVIEKAEENRKLVDYYVKRGEYKYIIGELSLAYAAERLADNCIWYDEKNKRFMRYFTGMSVLVIVTILLVIISIAL